MKKKTITELFLEQILKSYEQLRVDPENKEQFNQNYIDYEDMVTDTFDNCIKKVIIQN